MQQQRAGLGTIVDPRLGECDPGTGTFQGGLSMGTKVGSAAFVVLLAWVVMAFTWSLRPHLAWADAGGDAAPVSAEARVVELLVGLAGGLDKAPDKCPQAAQTLRTWTETHAAELRELAELTRARADGLDDESLRALERQLEPAMEVIIGVAMRCAESAEVIDAFAALDAVLNGPAT